MTQVQARSFPPFQSRHLGLSPYDRAPPPSVRWWQLAKKAVLSLLLAVAFLCYYLLDTFVAALSLL